MKDEIYLIDGSAYIYRAYHAIAPLSNSSGTPTHAVLGFINIIKRIMRERQPRFLAVAFDSRGKVFRHDLYGEYKANRPPMPKDLSVQIPYIQQYVEDAGIPVLKETGVEADDLIASAALRLSRGGNRVVIVSGDKDLLQLVGDNIVMWDPMKDKTMTREEVEKKYGVPLESLLDTFALMGDSADNIPGIPGVGPKTAEKLISTYGSLDGIYSNLDSMKKSKMKEKIIAGRDGAYLSRDLIRLKVDVDVPEGPDGYKLREPDDKRLAAMYGELEFTALLKGIDTAESVPVDGFMIIRSREQLQEVMKDLQEKSVLAVDTETTSLDARNAGLVGITLAHDISTAYYIPMGHLGSDGKPRKDQLPEELVREVLTPLFLDREKIIVGHNLKYDLTVLRRQWNIRPKGRLFDTMIAAYLTESGGRSLKLDDLCRERGVRLTSFSEVVDDDKRENCFAHVDIDRAGIYSCEDVYGALLLFNEFKDLLAVKDLESLFFDVEMEIVSILVAMEITGICIDENVLQKLSSEFSGKLLKLEEEIYLLAGHEFNINSPKQLGQILFEELELPHGRKTKTGYSTDVKVLEKLAGKHPLPEKILRYRTLTKLLTTYVEKLSQLKDPVTGRIHTSFNQAVTATGRLSSSDPNLQNIPVRSEEGNRIREAFVPGEGLIFLSADYSQIDLRVLAHYSGDRALTQAFLQGDDIHTRTAAEIFSVSPLLVNAEMRRVAKSINFGIVYGMSSFGLSSQLNISRKEAQRFIDRYFHLYSGVEEFMVKIVEEAREKGYVTTLLKRRRSVPEIHAKNKMRREFAERMAINTPIQGTAADIIKLAMIGCDGALEKAGLSARMLLQIHDELVFELPEAELEKTQSVVKAAMENALELAVPLVVNFETGKNLAKS
ncbi:DNA polymerase I [Desulfomarina sp.]